MLHVLSQGFIFSHNFSLWICLHINCIFDFILYNFFKMFCVNLIAFNIKHVILMQVFITISLFKAAKMRKQMKKNQKENQENIKGKYSI